MKMKKIIINKPDEFKKIIKLLINLIKKQNDNNAVIVKLYGDLGSGKTTFVQEFAKFLNIKERITSPTFIISKKYKIPQNIYLKQKTIIHIDSYRLNIVRDLENIDFLNQIKNNKNLIFIEWPEICDKLNLKNCINLKFKYLNKNSREIIIE